jgi:hypothetical protein
LWVAAVIIFGESGFITIFKIIGWVNENMAGIKEINSGLAID